MDELSIIGEVAEITPVSLRPRRDLTMAEWLRMGEELMTLANAVAWAIGDWLLYGESRYGEAYAQAIQVTRLSYQTLANMRWVAGRIPPERRHPALSWSHHVEVAALDPDAQDYWLNRAEEEGMSRDELRQAIHGDAALDRPMPWHAWRLEDVPDVPGTYLVYVAGRRQPWALAVWDGEGWTPDDDVAAWMPLPPPPELLGGGR